MLVDSPLTRLVINQTKYNLKLQIVRLSYSTQNCKMNEKKKEEKVYKLQSVSREFINVIS